MPVSVAWITQLCDFYNIVSGLSAPPGVSTWPTDRKSVPWPIWLTPADNQLRFADPLVSVLDASDFRWTQVEVPAARRLGRAAFQDAVADAYRTIHRGISESEHHSPVRYWSFIPGIHDPMDCGLDRYMAFNSGRFAAFTERAGSREATGLAAPTASGVGSEDDALVVACLSSRVTGRLVENPRQIPAYRYSARFGPRPPVFARATLVPGRGAGVLLVGGTASITGEESRHAGDLDAQVDETLRNLAAVAAAAGGGSAAGALSHYRFLRVFVPGRTDAASVRDRLQALLPAGIIVEWRQAELCREELLVEIEGVALLPHSES